MMPRGRRLRSPRISTTRSSSNSLGAGSRARKPGRRSRGLAGVWQRRQQRKRLR